jgi:hypothetical protein
VRREFENRIGDAMQHQQDAFVPTHEFVVDSPAACS